MNKHFIRRAALGLALTCPFWAFSQPNFTANEQVATYSGDFRAGYNSGYQPGWNDQQLANIAAGNPALGIAGAGCRSVRQGLYFELFNIWEYAVRVAEVQHYESLGMTDLTGLIWGGANGGSEAPPPAPFRDMTEYCPGQPSELFKNLYLPIWDANNGTPINEDNYFAAYLYKTVDTYKNQVRFWEIWNEPGYDFTGDTGWRPAGDPAGNWWDKNPDPCEYRLRAPIFHYIRMLRVAWEVVKTLDPDSFVCCGAPGYQSFLDAILRNTDNPGDGSANNTPGSTNNAFPNKGGAYFDALCYHSYPHFDGSTVLDPITKALMRTSDRAADGVVDTRNYFQIPLAAHGYDGLVFPKKQFVVTEINLPRRPFTNKAYFGSDLAQRNFMPKAMINCMKNGIPQMDIYALGERKLLANASYEFDLMGLYQRLDNLPPTSITMNEEGISLATASKLLFGNKHDAARSAMISTAPGIRAEAFKTSEPGKFVYAIWAQAVVDSSEVAAANFSFPAGMEFDFLEKRDWDFSQTGQVSNLQPTGIALTATPIFLTGKDKTISTDAAFSKTFSVEISPNPAGDELNLRSAFFLDKSLNIKVLNAFGQLIFEKKTDSPTTFLDEKLDVSELAPGLYFIEIKSGGRRQVVKFVKG